MIGLRGSRAITVANRRFRWKVRSKPTYAQAVAMTGVNIAVALAEGTGSTLVVHLGNIHPSNVMGNAPVGVTPAQVANCIVKALEAGWQPDLPGPAFELVLK